MVKFIQKSRAEDKARKINLENKQDAIKIA